MTTLLNLVAIGGSAGALDGLIHIAQRLPRDFKGAVLCVLHRSVDDGTYIPRILNRLSELAAVPAADGERIEPGRIYVVTVDRHLIVEDGTIRLSAGPKEHGFRPAIDPAFRSAAEAYGPRAVGVLLSGGLDDGVLGLAAIKARGGTAVVQDPAEAPFPSMPGQAIERLEIDHVLPVTRIPDLLTALAAGGSVPAPPRHETSRERAMETPAQPPISLACPDCGGESLLESHPAHVEETLWAALRSLEERASLFRQMASFARERDGQPLVERYDREGQELERHAEIMREFMERQRTPRFSSAVRSGRGSPPSRPRARRVPDRGRRSGSR